jgi:hypothetical protein
MKARFLTLLCGPILGVALQGCLVDNLSAPIGDIPGAVSSLSGVVHNDNETEIFWQAATDNDGVVVGYNIYRNDILIAQKIDALSYYDNSAQPANAYTYSVQAIDDNGNGGVRIDINLQTLSAYKAVSRENYIDVLEFVFSVYASELYQNGLTSAFSISDTFEAELIDNDPTSDFVRNSYTCTNGGTASSTQRSGHSTYASITMDQCQLDSTVHSGSITFTSKGERVFEYDYGDYSYLTSDDQTTTILGNYTTEGFVCRSDSRRSRLTRNFMWELSKSDGAIVISDANTQFSRGTLCGGQSLVYMDGSFTARSPQTGNKTITVSISTPFDNTVDSVDFPIGVLRIEGNDGTALTLNADNGDPATVSIQFDGTADNSEVIIEPWTNINTPLTVDLL